MTFRPAVSLARKSRASDRRNFRPTRFGGVDLPELFISHAAVDKPLAEFIENCLRPLLAETAIFRTTRVDQIPAGKAWLQHIHEHIKSAEQFIVLLTPVSVKRPWISFETGAAWASGKLLIPVVAGMRKEEVPEPLRSLQLLALEDPVEAAEAFRVLGANLKDPPTFTAAVTSLSATSARSALADEGWEYLEFNGLRFAWEGPFDRKNLATPVPERPGFVEAVKASGYGIVQGISGDLLNENSKGYVQIFEIDRFGRAHEIVGPHKQVYLIRPEGPRK
jgi:hypothetical protein